MFIIWKMNRIQMAKNVARHQINIQNSDISVYSQQTYNKVNTCTI